MLPDVHKILHLDTDILVLTDILNVWNHFEEMDRLNQIAAMAPEHMPPGDGWYNVKAKIPYYGARGLKTVFIQYKATYSMNTLLTYGGSGNFGPKA